MTDYFAYFLMRHTIYNIIISLSSGLLNSNGLHWVHDRRFVMRNLRDLGMGKTYLEQAILIEAQELVDEIKSLGESPMQLPRAIKTAVLNVIWQMVASKRYDLSNSIEVKRIFRAFDDFRDQKLIFFEQFFPVLKLLPQILRDKLFGTHVVSTFRSEIKKIISVSILPEYH